MGVRKTRWSTQTFCTQFAGSCSKENLPPTNKDISGLNRTLSAKFGRTPLNNPRLPLACTSAHRANSNKTTSWPSSSRREEAKPTRRLSAKRPRLRTVAKKAKQQASTCSNKRCMGASQQDQMEVLYNMSRVGVDRRRKGRENRKQILTQ